MFSTHFVKSSMLLLLATFRIATTLLLGVQLKPLIKHYDSSTSIYRRMTGMMFDGCSEITPRPVVLNSWYILGIATLPLPVYALDNALEINSNAVNLQLSQNPWACDCKFGMRFREILMKYHIIIQDSWNVTCSFVDEEENMVLSRVLSIQRTDVCKLPPDNSLFPVDLLNGILASLIIFILAKLGYDYYNYKNYGQLPWIVTKLP